MTKLAYKHISSIVDDYDVFLFDLWGVIVEGNFNYPGVINNINQLIKKDKKVFFVTNAPRNSNYLFTQMTNWGVNVKKETIISSGELAIEMICNSEEKFGITNPVVYHLGHEDNNLINDYCPVIQSKIPITTDIDKANILLLTLYCDEGENLNLDQFDQILKEAVKRKIITICANPDLGIMQQGIYRYCSGYFAAKVKQFGGNVIYTGKPYSEIYKKVLNLFPNISKKRFLMIGDTFYTDILGANKIGIDSALVLTGNAAKFHSQYYTIEEKLLHIKIAATEQQVMPSFVIQLGEKKEFFHN